jgi:hypothetical protein
VAARRQAHVPSCTARPLPACAARNTGAEQLPALSCRPEPLPDSRPPPFPETLEGGLKRYGRSVQRLAWAFPGLTLLLVSHGEVGAAACVGR